MIEFLNAEHTGEILALQDKNEFSDGWNQKAFISAFLRGDFFVLGYKKEGQLLGYISYTLSIDTADIELILVARDFRKRGIAKRLLFSAENEIRKTGASKILLEVRANNIPAISLYESMGYSKIHVRKKYYEDGIDALILAKELL